MKRLIVVIGVIWLFLGSSYGQSVPEVKIHGHYLFRLNNIYSSATAREIMAFEVRRAYFDVGMKFDSRFSVRWTSDILLDNSGIPSLRLKYAYATYKIGKLAWFEHLKINAGQLPRPWISYQEKFNKYKVFEDMFLETAGLVNSTDRGISLEAKLGGEIDDTTFIGENGRLGSVMIGLYNGGGYMSNDLNNNKTFEFRLTLRPLYNIMPRLLYVVTGVAGKTNISPVSSRLYDSAWVVFVNQYLVYATSRFVFSAQFEYGEGDVFGDNFYVYDLTPSGLEIVAQHHYGFSLFGDFGLISKLYIFGRYDFFKVLRGSQILNVFYTGLRYEMNRWSFIGLQYKYDFLSGSNLSAGVQIKF